MNAVEAMNAADGRTMSAAEVVGAHAWRLLGADRHEWVIALVAALVAAPVYDLIVSSVGRVTLRLPFLILWLARPQMSRDAWQVEYQEWKAELWEVLHEKDRPWLRRFGKGLWWSIEVVCRARQTARADKRVAKVRRFAPSTLAAIRASAFAVSVISALLGLASLTHFPLASMAVVVLVTPSIAGLVVSASARMRPRRHARGATKPYRTTIEMVIQRMDGEFHLITHKSDDPAGASTAHQGEAEAHRALVRELKRGVSDEVPPQD